MDGITDEITLRELRQPDTLTRLMFGGPQSPLPSKLQQFGPLWTMLPQSKNVQDERANPVRPRPNGMFDLIRKFEPSYGPLSIQAGALSMSPYDPQTEFADLLDAADREKLKADLLRY